MAASRRRKEFLSYQPTIGGSVCEQQRQHPGGGSLVATAVIESSISFGEETETNDDDDNESSSTDNNAAVERGEGHYFVTCHMMMFFMYKVSPGFSLTPPPPLNGQNMCKRKYEFDLLAPFTCSHMLHNIQRFATHTLLEGLSLPLLDFVIFQGFEFLHATLALTVVHSFALCR